MIRATNVSFAYDEAQVLSGVDLHAASGKMVGLIGPNGSGKSTLLRTLYAALRPKTGRIQIGEDVVSSLSPRELPKRVAVVAQEPSSEAVMSVADMVLLGRSPHRSSFHSYSAEDYEIAADALRKVGLRHMADRRFHTMSGGEKQRAFIARALAQQAEQLLLDEPTNHLDIHYQHDILQLVRSLRKTTVVVLHDLNLAARYCDELVLLNHGKVVSSGPTAEVLVPEVIEPVYRMKVTTLYDEGRLQLVFRPLDRAVSVDKALV
ncbi:ABC transporter ATP-binding protein [Aureibacillus halotolerans]|uniref:Iron complex transport system ATP-binding protein n=1 Tax=Aureibacillus halotolerans TaxID=1508390 RepID=A0A4R6U917_9BACI|nr:ABC transporter ATP-binding protein [Aureibacillus halotolerans]TDQ41155.1 iron complex transport system ATP-binding protein [Aureibacillus halotolerans]